MILVGLHISFVVEAILDSKLHTEQDHNNQGKINERNITMWESLYLNNQARDAKLFQTGINRIF